MFKNFNWTVTIYHHVITEGHRRIFSLNSSDDVIQLAKTPRINLLCMWIHICGYTPHVHIFTYLQLTPPPPACTHKRTDAHQSGCKHLRCHRLAPHPPYSLTQGKIVVFDYSAGWLMYRAPPWFVCIWTHHHWSIDAWDCVMNMQNCSALLRIPAIGYRWDHLQVTGVRFLLSSRDTRGL